MKENVGDRMLHIFIEMKQKEEIANERDIRELNLLCTAHCYIQSQKTVAVAVVIS